MMKTSKKRTRPIITNLLWGLLIGIIISIVFSGIVGLFVLNDGVAEENTKYFAMVIQFIAAFVGSVFVGKRVGQKYAIVCGCSAAIYCLVLVASTIMFFDGAFQSVGMGVGMCAAGYVVACAMCMMNKRKGHRRK